MEVCGFEECTLTGLKYYRMVRCNVLDRDIPTTFQKLLLFMIMTRIFAVYSGGSNYHFQYMLHICYITLIPFSHGRRKAGRTRVELGWKRVSAFT